MRLLEKKWKLFWEKYKQVSLQENGYFMELIGNLTIPAVCSESKGLGVKTHIADEQLPVKIDVEKMVRVFENVLSNAEKYGTKESDIIVKAERKSDNVTISISNKGEYIEQDKLDKIFDKFFRVDISRASNSEGSGLGIAISKK